MVATIASILSPITRMVTPQDTQNLVKVTDKEYNNNMEKFIDRQCKLYSIELESEFSYKRNLY